MATCSSELLLTFLIKVPEYADELNEKKTLEISLPNGKTEKNEHDYQRVPYFEAICTELRNPKPIYVYIYICIYIYIPID